MRRLLGLVLLAVLSLAAPAAAHDSPEHEIDYLTAQIAKRGASASLLFRRACEYRVMGQLDRAHADLERALKLDAKYPDARLELARVELAQKQSRAALETINQALAAVKVSEERAPLLVVRSDIRLSLGELKEALADCQSACQVRLTEVDWLLKRSWLQSRLGLHEQRAADLAAAYKLLPSAVLKIERVEAALDAGKMQAALDTIEPELAQSRWQSAWLIRRARALQGLMREADAKADLEAAIAEIDRRLNPERPDLMLLCDRGLAHALIGNRQAAAKDLAAAKAQNAEPWLLARLEAAVNGESTTVKAASNDNKTTSLGAKP